jgi:hypothetical protein
MKICYVSRDFSEASERTIDLANKILAEYARQGYDLTLRQLYYQFVARGLIANKDTEYKKLGSVINDARLAGRIDWDHITDRTRNLRSNPHWETPESIIESCAAQFQHDKWKTQRNYVEVWVEKDALVGVLQVACQPLDVPYFSCRGYTSQSEMWAASQRLLKQARAGKQITIIHLGDHDPSGVDMSRDIEDRIKLFLEHHLMRDHIKKDKVANDIREGETIEDWISRTGYKAAHEIFTLNRIALNMAQVREYDPPPNPAKITDSRATGYIAEHGGESWELDALEPAVLTALIQNEVFALRDIDEWELAVEREDEAKEQLKKCAERWDEVVTLVTEGE